MDLVDCAFRYHYSFIFIALNIRQRRSAHLFTSLTVKSSKFQTIAEKLVSISPEVLLSAAKLLEKEGNTKSFSSEEKEVFNLLKEVNTIAAHIPGSQSSKIPC